MNVGDELGEWAAGGHEAIRSMVKSLNGDLSAFDHDPLTFQHLLDDFVRRLPLEELEDDDWVWVHTQLAAYLAEVLIRCRGGHWEKTPESTYVVVVEGPDGRSRQVDPFKLVDGELRPIPQRVPRLIERALSAAGY
ncbi:hypothetical protein [Spirillospora sp. NPDC047279]|uniref:hypothetical protein n=1 Tax=Spirillospora sp. NPDC047279 TaxID=3155478 RepID=UPI0033C187BD